MTSWMKKFFFSKKDSDRQQTNASHSSTQQKLRTSVSGRKIPQTFQAVSIYSRTDCCDAAKRITGQKFLAAHAPQLPLGGCSQPEQCHCRYKHLSDRREEMRRDTDNGLPARQMLNGERRNRRDRRRHFVS